MKKKPFFPGFKNNKNKPLMVYEHFKELTRRFLSPFAGCTNTAVDSDKTVQQQKEYAHYVQNCFQNTTLRSHFPVELLSLFFQLEPSVLGFAYDLEQQCWKTTTHQDALQHGGLQLLWDLYGFQPQLPSTPQTVHHITRTEPFHDRIPCTSLVDQALGCTTADAMTTYILDGLYQNAIAWSILKMGSFRFYPVFQDLQLLTVLTSCMAQDNPSKVTSSIYLPCRVLFYVPDSMFKDDQLEAVHIHHIIQERQRLKETKLVDCLHQLSAMVMRYGAQVYIVLVPFFARITPFSTSAHRLHYMFTHCDQFECSYEDVFIMKELLQCYLETDSSSCSSQTSN